LNISKCRIYRRHVPGHIKEKIARTFVFPIITTWNYFKYLGILIFLNSYGSPAWQEIIGKYQQEFKTGEAVGSIPQGKLLLSNQFSLLFPFFNVQAYYLPKVFWRKSPEH
jgi:hypothetical protein